MEIIGCIFVVIAMVVIAGNVFKRWITGSPMHGAYELAGLCACMFVSVCIPMAVASEGHTSVEIIYRKINKTGKYIMAYMGVIFDLLAGGLMSFASYRLGWKMMAIHETTDSLLIPRWPFRLLWGTCMLMFCIFTISKALEIPAKIKQESEPLTEADIAQKEIEEVERGGVEE